MKKTILITGASGAIGSMVAYKAALKKYNIVMQYKTREQECKSLAAQLENFGCRVLCVGADITLREDRQRLVQAAVDTFGSIDILINNAGGALYGLLTDCAEEQIDEIIVTDLTAQILLTKTVLPHMIAKHEGSVVNISSIWGITGGAGESVYSAAKAGLIGFTKALAKETAGGGVRVNCVAPGCVQSRMMEHFTQEEMKGICENIPMGRLADALEIAESILFIAEQSYTTGQVFSPNGGMVI